MFKEKSRDNKTIVLNCRGLGSFVILRVAAISDDSGTCPEYEREVDNRNGVTFTYRCILVILFFHMYLSSSSPKDQGLNC